MPEPTLTIATINGAVEQITTHPIHDGEFGELRIRIVRENGVSVCTAEVHQRCGFMSFRAQAPGVTEALLAMLREMNKRRDERIGDLERELRVLRGGRP